MAGHSAIMSVRITGNANDAVKAFEKATGKAVVRADCLPAKDVVGF